MKALIIISMVACAVNAFGFHDTIQHNPRNLNLEICVGQPDGVRIRDPFYCNVFYVCDQELGMRLTCRSTAPNFDRCTDRCSEDPAVCQNTCDGGQPTDPPTTPQPEETQPPEETPAPGPTTIQIPTVPVATTPSPE